MKTINSMTTNRDIIEAHRLASYKALLNVLPYDLHRVIFKLMADYDKYLLEKVNKDVLEKVKSYYNKPPVHIEFRIGKSWFEYSVQHDITYRKFITRIDISQRDKSVLSTWHQVKEGAEYKTQLQRYLSRLDTINVPNMTSGYCDTIMISRTTDLKSGEILPSRNKTRRLRNKALKMEKMKDKSHKYKNTIDLV